MHEFCTCIETKRLDMAWRFFPSLFFPRFFFFPHIISLEGQGHHDILLDATLADFVTLEFEILFRDFNFG